MQHVSRFFTVFAPHTQRPRFETSWFNVPVCGTARVLDPDPPLRHGRDSDADWMKAPCEQRESRQAPDP